MKKLWKFLSGKKTVISAVIAITTTFLHTRGIIDSGVTEFVMSLNTVLFGVGVGHKIKKFKTKKNGKISSTK